MKKYSAILLKVYSFIVGVVFGMFLGLFVVGTAIRLLLDVIFHYRDSEPMWVNVLLAFGTLVSVVVCTYISMSWARIRLAKGNSPGRTMPRGDSATPKNG